MISFKTEAFFSLFATAKYERNIDYSNDYRNLPRPCHNIAFMLEGEGEIASDGEIITVKKGDILYIPQGTTYISNWKGAPNVIYHTIHFNFSDSCDPFDKFNIKIQLLKCKNFETTYDKFKIIHEAEKGEFSLLSASAFFTLCAELISDIEINRKKENNNPVSPAIEYLKANSSAPCTIERLADLCFLSPSRFHYLFKKHTGRTPIAYKNEILIRKAAQAITLKKDKSIESISEEYGFDSVIYFRRLFKRMTGKTPLEYRKDNSLL